MIVIRPETPADIAAIFHLNRLAFGGDTESRLVDRLRDGGNILCSLVAEDDTGIIGHILFSELPIETDAAMIRAAALAPMAVKPGQQRRGIGSQLVRAGIEACRAASIAAIVVVGHVEYYPRFGFSREKALELDSPYDCEACMALELDDGVLTGVRGRVRYAKAFDGL